MILNEENQVGGVRREANDYAQRGDSQDYDINAGLVEHELKLRSSTFRSTVKSRPCKEEPS